MNKQLIIGVLIAGLVGYFLGASFGLGGSNKGLNNMTGDTPLPTMPDSNFISGQVKSIEDNILFVHTPRVNSSDQMPEERQVTVGISTKLIKMERKTEEVIQKELQEYQKKIAEMKPGSTEPLPGLPVIYFEKEISLDDIKPGDFLSIEAESGIRMLEKFSATKITVQENIAPITPTINIPTQ